MKHVLLNYYVIYIVRLKVRAAPKESYLLAELSGHWEQQHFLFLLIII